MILEVNKRIFFIKSIFIIILLLIICVFVFYYFFLKLDNVFFSIGDVLL